MAYLDLCCKLAKDTRKVQILRVVIYIFAFSLGEKLLIYDALPDQYHPVAALLLQRHSRKVFWRPRTRSISTIRYFVSSPVRVYGRPYKKRLREEGESSAAPAPEGGGVSPLEGYPPAVPRDSDSFSSRETGYWYCSARTFPELSWPPRPECSSYSREVRR